MKKVNISIVKDEFCTLDASKPIEWGHSHQENEEMKFVNEGNKILDGKDKMEILEAKRSKYLTQLKET